MIPDFYKQYPQPIDTTEINWDILGLIEVRTLKDGEMFRVQKNVSYKDVLEFTDKNASDHIFSTNLLLADLKVSKVLEAVKELRQKIESKFSIELEKFENKDRVVQLVKTPLCFLDNAPGDIQISFDVYTERRLGTIDELEEEEKDA